MSTEAFLAVRNRSIVTRVPLKNILYVMRSRRKLFVICEEASYEYYENIDNIAPLFGEGFFRVNDGCFVNLSLIDKVEGETVIFRNKERLMLSREAAVRCKQRFYVFLKTGERFIAAEALERAWENKRPGVKNVLDNPFDNRYNL